MVRGALELEPGVALAARDLSKRTTNIHEIRYAPAVTVAARLRDRLSGGTGRAPVGGVYDSGAVGDDEDDDDDGDDDIDDEDDLTTESAPETATLEWPLRNVDFTLLRGTALGVVGDRDCVDALIRILVRMTAPTEGSIVYRGRIGLSYELARTLARRELGQPRHALRSLASLAGVSRRERSAWMGAGFELITGDPSPRITLANARDIGERVPFAASLDPTANVLVVDRFPLTSDKELFARSLTRLRERLSAGAAAIVASRDTTLISEVCSTAIRLEQGRVVEFGPIAKVIDDFERQQSDSKRRTKATVPAFNEDVALASAVLETEEGERPELVNADDAPRLKVAFETAQEGTAISWRLILSGPRLFTLSEPRTMPAARPGPYAATFAIPTSQLETGDYTVVVEARVLTQGRRSILRRQARGRLRADAAPDVRTPESDLEGLVAEWTALGED
jgi:ABC-type polysaccharide/polyol phosphate transport system ATPase subunit